MKLSLKRIALRPTYTIGRLYIDGEYFCDTVEDTVRDLDRDGRFANGEQKVYAQTAIPYGTYAVEVTYSPKFCRELPLLKDVPHFTGIRIHRGNTAGDSAGCIIVGENKEVGKVLNSTPYEQRITALLKGRTDVTIEIS